MTFFRHDKGSKSVTARQKPSRLRRVPCLMGGGLMALCASLTLSTAHAQDPKPIDITGKIVMVPGIVDGNTEFDADAELRAKASTVLENGIELGGGASVRADADDPSERYAGGRYSSPLSGGDRGVGDDAADIYLEGVYLFARGGFGSVHVGRDAGVASRLAVTSPTIFESIGVNDWRSDLTGLNDVHTVNDFSGMSPKVTYMPPAGLLGGIVGQVQLGLSYAPELEACGDDGCAPVAGFAYGDNSAQVAAGQSWQDVVETAVYYQNGFDVGEDPLRIGVSASYMRARDNNASTVLSEVLQPLFDDYKAYAFGLNLAYRNVTVGGSVKSTNTGLDKDRDEDYLAFDAGITFEAGEWNFMVGYGAADAERDASLLLNPTLDSPLPLRLDRQTQTAQAGISYVFDHGVTLGAAAQFVDSEKDVAVGGPEEAAVIVLESSFKF